MVKKLTDNTANTNRKLAKKKRYNDDGLVPNKEIKIHHLNYGQEDQMEIFGFTPNHLKSCLIYICYFLTCGLLRLLFHWYPHWQLYATHSPTLLAKAQKVLIIDNYKGKFKSYFVKNVEIIRPSSTNDLISDKKSVKADRNDDDNPLLSVYLCDGSRKKLSEARVIRCKKLLYIWNDDKQQFVKLCGLDKDIRNDEFHTIFHGGYTKNQQNSMQIIYGPNKIDVPVQSIPKLLILEALTPFYMFQLFSLIVWLAELYFYYAIAIVIMSVFGIATSIIQTRKNQKNLRGTVHSIDTITILRRIDGKSIEEQVPTTDLVPGDVIIIPKHGCEMHCDAVLLNGNCIVNESMLTGESVPVTKTALPSSPKPYDIKEHTNHTLFCGTKVIQTRFYGQENVLAIVTRTGYMTSKGELVRSIMYPPPADFKFDQDSYKFIMILAFIALLGFVYTVFVKFSRNINAWDVIIKALDLVTIAIPPALPAAMTVGKLYALNRLKKQQIYCINSRVINVSGSVNCICFDKTGTLTEDGLDMWGVVPCTRDTVLPALTQPGLELTSENALLRGMLTCHSLTLIDDELCGDPLDVKMFEATGWRLEEPTMPDTSKYDLLVPTIVQKGSDEIGILQQYQFTSTLQRMSVISRRLGAENFEIFTKGAPETVISLCLPETVPPTVLTDLKHYTEQGYRVIGMAQREIHNLPFHKIPKMQREEVECNLTFCGLIVLENRLKPETNAIINELQLAAMKIVMITGDNVQTAVSVARECGILPAGHSVIEVDVNDKHKIEFRPIGSTAIKKAAMISMDSMDNDYNFVMTGRVWALVTQYHLHLLPKLVTRGAVFARMTSLQKQQLVEQLQQLGFYVAMCGDGANDCSALKAAHVGISLSEAESSVASPFTSRNANIACTVKVIKEGRAALVTSFGVFKMMLCYSLTEFGSCIILYAIDTNLTPLQFLFIDICLILNFATFFGQTKAASKLDKRTPMTSLLGLVPLTSLVLFMVIVMAFQLISYNLIHVYDWFEPFQFDPDKTTSYASFENYAVFTVSMFQYIAMTIVFSKGKPYRKPIWTNYYLMASLAVMTAICCYITLEPAEWVKSTLELKVPPQFDGKWPILAMALVNFFICLFVDDFLVDYLLNNKFKEKWKRVSKKYLLIENELKQSSDWMMNPEKGGCENKAFEIENSV